MSGYYPLLHSYVTFKVPRNRVTELHQWLDRFAWGWRYPSGRLTGIEAYKHHTSTRFDNDRFATSSTERGLGERIESMTFIVPKKHHVLMRMTWDCKIEDR